MTRYCVVFSDITDREISEHIVRAKTPVDAICNHPWIREIYRDRWILDNLWAPDESMCIRNVNEQLGWMVLCVNLDEAIMKDLNDGAGNVSSELMPQS